MAVLERVATLVRANLNDLIDRAEDPEIKRMCGLQLQRAYGGLGRDRNAMEVALELIPIRHNMSV